MQQKLIIKMQRTLILHVLHQKQLDIYKLVPVPVDLSKLSDLIKNDIVKKTVYDKLAAKVNNIDTSDFVLKTKYQTDKVELEKKISDVTNF